MKILTVTWKFFDCVNGIYEVSRNGGSVMISDICEYIGRKEQSFLFQGADTIPDMTYGHINVIGNSSSSPTVRTADNIGEWQQKLKSDFRTAVATYNFDFIFFHGNGQFLLNCIEICRVQEIPYAIVMHGNFMISSAHDTKENIEIAKKILSITDLNLITVSHGAASEFLKTCPYLSPRQISVIVNGIPPLADNKKMIKKIYDFGSRKVLLCSGSLSVRKNQIQLIRAFSLLPASLRNKIQLVLCGKDSKRQPSLEHLKMEISDSKLEEAVTYIGSVPRTGMNAIYEMADGLVLPSLMEGLSLVTLEAIQHGKPVIMFADNETASDVNSPDATILVKERSDQALADAIVEWYERDWDKKKIKEYSKNFTIERVADEYILYAKEHSREN